MGAFLEHPTRPSTCLKKGQIWPVLGGSTGVAGEGLFWPYFDPSGRSRVSGMTLVDMWWGPIKSFLNEIDGNPAEYCHLWLGLRRPWKRGEPSQVERGEALVEEGEGGEGIPNNLAQPHHVLP